MVNPTISESLMRELEHLSPDLQRRVLEFAHFLAASPRRGVPGKDLLGFAGVLSSEDAEAMKQAIEEGCEKVDESGW